MKNRGDKIVQLVEIIPPSYGEGKFCKIVLTLLRSGMKNNSNFTKFHKVKSSFV